MPHRPLLVFDFNGTLVFDTRAPLAHASAFQVPPFHYYVRPHLEPFLRACAAHFDLAIWSAGDAAYVGPAVAQVFPHDLRPSFDWTGERCRWVENGGGPRLPIKDLSLLEGHGFSLAKLLIVDDFPQQIPQAATNAVPIPSFAGDPADQVLQHLAPFLTRLAALEDLRTADKGSWRPIEA